MDERLGEVMEENRGKRGGLMEVAVDPLPLEIVVLTELIRQTWSEEERLLRARHMVVTMGNKQTRRAT